MRVLITLVLLTISSIAIACPDLTGAYVCKITSSIGTSGDFKLEISQAINNLGFTEYTIKTETNVGKSEETIVADNIERIVAEDEVTTKMRTYCAKNSNSLEVDISSTNKDGKVTSTNLSSIYKLNSANLVGDSKSTSTTENAQEYTFTSKTECKK
jgi:hypothetical protein